MEWPEGFVIELDPSDLSERVTPDTPLPETLFDAVQYFSDPDRTLRFVAWLRWPDGIACPRCQSHCHSFLKTRRLWKCRDCKKQFSVKAGTVFEDSPIDLGKWMVAFWLAVNAKNGISSYELARSLGVTQKTAWFMLHRIRHILKTGSTDKMGGTVEVDETFIGGLEKNKHADKKLHAGRGTVGKTTVVGILERSDEKQASQVRSAVQPGRTREVLHGQIMDTVTPGATVYTDTFPGYNGLAGTYRHESVDHAVKQYVREDIIHTNGIENYWSLVKRCVKGTHIHVEPFHLGAYLAEEDFRFNNRRYQDKDRLIEAVSLTAGKKLTYRELTSAYMGYYDTLTW